MGMPYYASTRELPDFRPCPFCGAERQTILERLTSWVPGRKGSVYTVHCSCGCEYSTGVIPMHKSRRETLEAIKEEWNGRKL